MPLLTPSTCKQPSCVYSLWVLHQIKMSITTLNSSMESRYVLITKDWSTVQNIAAIISTSLINAFAVVFNSLLVLTILFTKSLRCQPDTILIGNLALSDLLVACCIMPFTTVVLIQNEIDPSNPLWTFIGYSNFSLCIASILNLAVLSMDQCLNIRCPFWYELYRTRGRAFFMAACVWIYSSLCALPPLFGISSYTCFIPNTGPCSVYQWSGTNKAVIFTLLVTLCSWGIGVLILFTSNISIYFVIIKQRKAIQTTMVHKPDCPSNNPRGMKQVNSVNRSIPSRQPVSENGRYVDANSISRHCTSESPADLMSDHQSRATESRTVEKVTSRNLNADQRKWRLKRKRRAACKCFASTKHVKSLLIIVIAYFITWSPFCILLLKEITSKAKHYEDLSLIFLWIGHMSSFINPALYFFRYNRFREAAKIILRKVLNRARVHAS